MTKTIESLLGSKAPELEIPDQDGNIIMIDSLKNKWVVLYFYPKDDTPGCTIEAINFSKQLSKFKDLNTEIIGISADSEKSHCNFINKHALKITLLSDKNKTVVERYCVLKLKKMYGKEYMGINRSTFLIDPNGIIKHIWENVNVKDHSMEVIAKLQEINS